MSYADDFEDVGGYLAEQDYMASVCEEQDGDCSDCPEKDNCNYYEKKARWSYDKRRSYYTSATRTYRQVQGRKEVNI